MLLRKYLMGTPIHGCSAKESCWKRTWIVFYKASFTWYNLTNVVCPNCMVILLVCACLVCPDVRVHDERVLTCLILQSSGKREEVLQVWAATPHNLFQSIDQPNGQYLMRRSSLE